jgi:alkylated DNA repair dioxygenase AlkB
VKPIYVPSFLANPDLVFSQLMNLPWLEETEARKEYFMSDPAGISYTYGNAVVFRTYVSQPYDVTVGHLRNQLDITYNTNYDVCFLNRYDQAQNALGWHADDSPEMNPAHPIAVISVGAEREIWWKPQDMKGNIPKENKQLLQHGSLFLMPAGFQQLNYHKIPKSDKPCGVRISLTFRNYVRP